jgi:hypothetical protein
VPSTVDFYYQQERKRVVFAFFALFFGIFPPIISAYELPLRYFAKETETTTFFR